MFGDAFERAASSAKRQGARARQTVSNRDNIKSRTAAALDQGRNEAFALIDEYINKGLDDAGVARTNYALTGGIPLYKVREIYKQMRAESWSRQNLFHVSMVDISPTLSASKRETFNQFVVDVNYAPFTIIGEPTQVGSGNYDQITGSERVEMTVSMLDNQNGDVKKHLDNILLRMARPDGTFGLPIDYLQRVTVTHAFTDPDIKAAIDAKQDRYIMRFAGYQVNKDRTSQEVEQLEVNLVQFDTFTGIV